MQPSGPVEGVAGWGRHSQLGQVPQKGLWRDGFDSARVRVHELGRLDREGLAFLQCPSAHRIGWVCRWTVESVPNESIGLLVGEGVLSRWDGVAHEVSVGDGPVVSTGPEDDVVV